MAAKEGRELVKEAIRDAKALKEAALAAAKNELVEQMAPGVRALLEKQIRAALAGESVDRVNSQGADYYSPASREKDKKFQEGKDKGEDQMADEKDGKDKELDLESLSGMFPQLSEEPECDVEDEGVNPGPMGASGGMGGHLPEGDEEEGMHLKGQHGEVDREQHANSGGAELEDEGMSIPHLGEAEEGEEEVDGHEDGRKEKDDMDEEIEISEAALARVYEQALQTEASVSKGFKDMVGGGELEQASKETGILDKKSGEKEWDKEVPPDHVDYQIKEAIAKGIAENKMLRGKLKEAVALIKKLGGTLHETNLFNAKVLHVNRILNTQGRLTKEQKQVVLESIEKAKSVAQVKMVYETIMSSFKASAGALTESRAKKPLANAQGRRMPTAGKPEVLREQAEKASGGEGRYDRILQLAGLLK